jgi:hypothetical protein
MNSYCSRCKEWSSTHLCIDCQRLLNGGQFPIPSALELAQSLKSEAVFLPSGYVILPLKEYEDLILAHNRGAYA